MAYITGSLTDANPGPALHTLMATALTTAGFTLVDTVVISTRTHKIWKSPAAGNVQNLDWYLDIGYTTSGAGNITLQPFEFFDPATDLAYRGGYSANSTVIDATTFSRYGATGSALETNWIGATTFTGFPLPLVTSTFGYWASITADRVVLLTSNSPTKVVYCGFYLPDALYAAKAGAGLFPLACLTLTAGAGAASALSAPTATASLTRLPPATSLAGTGWAIHVGVIPVTNLDASSYPDLPSGPTTAYPLAALPLELLSSNAGGSTAAIRTRYGTLRDLAHVVSTGVTRGDTVTIAGAQWVLSSPAVGEAYLFKAA